MVTRWRRAFCTSIHKEDHDTKIFSEKQQTKSSSTSSSNPRISSRFGFFSSHSTPRLQCQPVSSPSLCRSSAATPASASVRNCPKLQCKTAPAPTHKKSSSLTNSPKTFHLSSSNPSSPKSPSSFSFLRASLRFSRRRCGICLQRVKTGQGTAIFTAECSHTFHFPCIAAHVKKHRTLVCPVCSATWKEIPLLDHWDNSPNKMQSSPMSEQKAAKVSPNTKHSRVYDDDESLLSPSSVSRFNPIPESDESGEDQQPEEFQGLFVDSVASTVPPRSKPPRSNVEISLLQESAVVSVNKNYCTYAVVLKVKAPPAPPNGSPPRAPVDLVVVLDVSACMNSHKLHVMKRAMRLVISSLSDADRLSIVAFSATSKRLLPLKRMTVTGRRSARRIIDVVGCTGQPASVNNALRKAAKVLEDRREKNPVAAILLLSNAHDQRVHASATDQKRSYPVVTSTRLGDIPIHAIGFGDCDQAAPEESCGRRLVGLLSVAVQDLRLRLGFVPGSDPAEITAVYSLVGRQSALRSGLIRVGDLCAEEERELLVELKVRYHSSGPRLVMSVGSSYRDPSCQELLYSKEQPIPVPRPQPVRSPSIQRLKNLHITSRAIAESRQLVDRTDLSGAYHMLSSARALLVQSGLGSGDEFLRYLEAELAELQRIRQAAQRKRTERRDNGHQAEEKLESLTPTSAWRAAERLAKVAIMRKSMNRVSDLHGFEDARF